MRLVKLPLFRLGQVLGDQKGESRRNKVADWSSELALLYMMAAIF